jgi:nucleoside-diphosphate-sugar epimerase
MSSPQSSAATPVALVTGATGFIGSQLLPALHRSGWQVRACGRAARPSELPGFVDYRQVDLTAAAPPVEACRGATHVFHVAGASTTHSTPAEMQRVNVDGTQRLLEAVDTRALRRFVYVSTSSVYGTKVLLPQPIREDAPPHPGPGYGQTKLAAEQVTWDFAARGLPVTVLRPVTVYGPGAPKLLGSTILDAALERFAGLRAFAVGRDPVELRMVHIDDVVAGLLHIATSDAAVGGTFNLSADTYPTSLEVAETVADELGLDLELCDGSPAGLPASERAAVHARMLAAGMRDRIVLSSERTRFLNKANPNNRLSTEALRATGFEPGVTDLPASIRASVRWYQAQRWIL